MQMGYSLFYASIPEIEHASCELNEELFKITIITTVCYKKIHSPYKHIFMARPGPKFPGS